MKQLHLIFICAISLALSMSFNACTSDAEDIFDQRELSTREGSDDADENSDNNAGDPNNGELSVKARDFIDTYYPGKAIQSLNIRILDSGEKEYQILLEDDTSIDFTDNDESFRVLKNNGPTPIPQKLINLKMPKDLLDYVYAKDNIEIVDITAFNHKLFWITYSQDGEYSTVYKEEILGVYESPDLALSKFKNNYLLPAGAVVENASFGMFKKTQGNQILSYEAVFYTDTDGRELLVKMSVDKYGKRLSIGEDPGTVIQHIIPEINHIWIYGTITNPLPKSLLKTLTGSYIYDDITENYPTSTLWKISQIKDGFDIRIQENGEMKELTFHEDSI